MRHHTFIHSSVPIPVRIRIEREIAKYAPKLGEFVNSDERPSRSRFENRLIGYSSPLVRRPFTPFSILSRVRKVQDENERRRKFNETRINPEVVISSPAFLDALSTDARRLFETDEFSFSAVFVRSLVFPSLHSNGALAKLPKICRVTIGFMSDTITITDPSILRHLEIKPVFQLGTFDTCISEGVVEDFSRKQYVIRADDFQVDQKQSLIAKLTELFEYRETPYPIKTIVTLADVLDTPTIDLLRRIGFRVAIISKGEVSRIHSSVPYLLLHADGHTVLPSPIPTGIIRISKKDATTILECDSVLQGVVQRTDSFTTDLLGIIDILARP